MVTDQQVRKLMEEMAKHGQVGLAAMRCGMDRKTARRYVAAGRLPSEMRPARTWRTRPDPFEEDWPAIEAMLESAPDLEAKAIFEHLQGERPGRYQEGQLRTLQRRVKQWRATRGPDKEVFFPQQHRPGEAMQTDFTWASELRVTIGGEPFSHMLCHSVLPYSNWESVTACLSESMEALRRGVQTALFRLGRVPRWHQTDHSTAATHREMGTAKGRRFNERYVSFCDHFRMKPRTTGVGKKEQNGDIEAANGALKRRLEQRLLLRGSRDFASVSAYETWLHQDSERANRGRGVRLADEMAVMRPLPASRLVEYTEIATRVTSASTISIRKNVYSVPSRLIGEAVRVRLHDTRLEVFYGGLFQLEVERLRGEGRHRVNYRHVIESLVRKPGAFARYRYRDELFPGVVFRRAYDRLCAESSEREADLHYLRVLHLAARTSETLVRSALAELEQTKTPARYEVVKEMVAPERVAVPAIEVMQVELGIFDELLETRGGMDG